MAFKLVITSMDELIDFIFLIRNEHPGRKELQEFITKLHTSDQALEHAINSQSGEVKKEKEA